MKIKIIFLFVSFLLLSNLSFAQVWSLTELIKLACMNVDDADTYITSKSYSFGSVKHDDDGGESRTYAYNKTSSEQKAPYWLTLFSYPANSSNKNTVAWETTKVEEYSNFKKQIKPAGFIFKSSQLKNKNSTVSEYTKGKYILEITVVDRSEEYKKNVIQYIIDLTIKK